MRHTPTREWWRIPLVIAMKDLAQLAGASMGLLDELLGRGQPNPHGDATPSGRPLS